MKKITLFIICLISIILHSFTIASESWSNEEGRIRLEPWLNFISTPAIVKSISFNNWWDNISFASMENWLWKPITVTNNNVSSILRPLNGYIVNNNNSQYILMRLTYDTNTEVSTTFLSKKLDTGRNLLWITTKDSPFDSITNTTITKIVDLSKWIITWVNPENILPLKLWKAYGIYINQPWTYGWWNNYAELDEVSESECKEICENDDEYCPKNCRIWTLTGNIINNASLNINNDLQESIYNWELHTSKLINLNSIYVKWNNNIPEWDSLIFYIYINEEYISEFQLTSQDNNKIKEGSQYYRPEQKIIKVNSWNNVPIEIKAEYNWSNKNTDYNYEFKILWNNIYSYEINSQTLPIHIIWNDISETPIDENFIEAYNRANNLWILNNTTINNKNLNYKISNTNLIIVINNYVKNILNREIDWTKDCSFIDTTALTKSQTDAIIEACQLWLIQENDNIDLNDYSNISSFSVLLSRALRDERYNWWNPEYQDHLNALQTAWILKSTLNPQDNELKWDALVTLMNSEWKNEYRRVPNSYNFLTNDFNAVEDVYTGVRTSEWDRVIFIVRHSARENNCTSNGGLTEYWMELASWVWEKLKWEPFTDTSTDFYGSSHTKRTVQTSYYVGKSRGNEDLNNNVLLNWNERKNYNYVNHDNSTMWIVEVTYGNYFSDWNWYSCIEHLYEENKETTNKKALYAINRICNITDWHPLSRITSHDWYTLPITERATNEELSFSTSNNDRPNFMQWVAIIVHQYGWWEIYPIRSLDTGKIKTRENPGC